MFVGAICHDLDHRGFNNKFMIDVGSPLAAIYSTSTMEHHHFNMTVTILQQVSKYATWNNCWLKGLTNIKTTFFHHEIAGKS